MAEFTDIMRQWRRMCTTVGDDCGGCKLYQKEGNSNCLAVYEGDIDCDLVESVVMAWAKEHPEPVYEYPTWLEYLQSIGVLGVNAIQTMENRLRNIQDLQRERVPKDIAEALGIEPKAVKLE